MNKLNKKLFSIIFLLTTVVLFSSLFFLVTQAQVNTNQDLFSYKFTRNLTVGSKGEDVKYLQQFLNSQGFKVSTSGPGSSNNETILFGNATRKALSKWQIANNIFPSVGYFGPKSRSTIATIVGVAIPLPSSLLASIPVSATLNQTPKLVDSILNKNTTEQVNPEFPVRLKIPIINVDATIEYVGLTPDGAMDVPVGPSNAAWFSPGTIPGENGSAVLAGHFGWKNGIPAVFDNLYKLQKGDKLYVENKKGETVTFVVRESRKYDPKADASDVFGSIDEKAHLNLVTCGGVWNDISKSRPYRLIVFTDKE